MKRILFTCFLFLVAVTGYSQVYYWVGGTTPSTSITIGTNWNTSLDGTGSPRPSSSGSSDILIFDGTNVGGSSPATGPVTVLANGSITAAQIRLVNNANIAFVRGSTGTSTVTIAGSAGDDFVVEAGSSFFLTSVVGSIRIAMGAANTGRVSGAVTMVTPLQARFDNTTAGTPGTFVFTNGSSLTSNITSTSSSYAFGGNTQSSEKWVVFEDGAHLYYNGGFSPMGNNSAFSAIDLKPGSTWHHRANNPATGFGSFFNRKSFGNISVENNATLTADGPIYRINNLTINNGSSFITHSSGQTAIMGNIVVDGSLSSPAAGTNELLLAGNVPQTISGTGSVSVGGLVVASNADLVLNKSIGVDQAVLINGKINFNTYQLTGNATFLAEGILAPVAGAGNLVAGNFHISGNTGIAATARGLAISGPGIPANTAIVSFSLTNDTIYLSHPITTTGTAVALQVSNSGATLRTANTNGFDPAGGSVVTAGNKTYSNNINYTINAATSSPFGITTGSSATSFAAGFVEINAPVTVNNGFSVSQYLTINGKISLRPLDIVQVLSGAVLNGTFNATNYIATGYNAATGEQSALRYDGLATSTVLPVGTANHYLPVTLNPVASSNFSVSVFEGITTNGAVNGTPLTPVQKQTVVNAVWNINRLSGSGNSGLILNWTPALEGSTFATLPSSDIGLIANTGTSWALPVGTGNNTANTVSATVTSFGAFSAGAIPATQPFIFNAIPAKTYGDADFNGGATSLNTTQPIIYSSNNTAVATIVAGNIHIVGAGTAVITASQVTDGFYPAASVTRTLTVNQAALTITADNKIKFEGQANPTLTATYTGFVLGETATVLQTAVTISTTAVLASPPGTYPITVSGAVAANYTITYVNGTLTIQPKQNQTITFAAPAVKTYGNPDFATGATSTNSTIPITYTSSNTNVATIIGSNIHIVGAGTANITASQAGNAGYFPAPDVTRTLTVNKAGLTIRVLDTVRVQGQANPVFTITYTGFVLGETSANLLTPVAATTAASEISSPGYYPITLGSATSNNYNIIYINGRLTVLPLTGTTEQNLNAYMSNSSTLTIRVYSPNPALADIQLYDMSGKPMLQKNLFMPAGFISTDIPVSRLPSGLYIVTLRGEGVDLQKTIRIIK